MTKLWRIGIATALLSLALASPSKATVLYAFELNGNYNNSLANGGVLTANGGSIGPNGYSFNANQGLSIGGLSIPGNGPWAIETRFSFKSTPGYRKIIDFKGLTSDTGLYNNSGGLHFYNVATSLGGIAQDSLVTVGLTRSAAGVVNGYLDGILKWTFNDTGSLSVFSVLNFFQDDTATGGLESSAGYVDFIRIGDTDKILSVDFPPPPGTVPVPAALPLLATALGALGFAGWRRSQRAA